MTEFKITPEDVGKIAVDADGDEFEIVYADESNAAASMHGGGLYVFGVDGYSTDCENLTHWKPRTLEAPKRWWNVYRQEDGSLTGWDRGTYSESVGQDAGAIARIYAEHWHGCEEGRFDTPETIHSPEQGE